MTSVTYRPYRPGDEDAITTLWNACLPGDLMTRLRFRNLVLLDPNFDPQGLRIAEQEGRMVGVLYAVRRRLPMIGTELELDHGWITFFYTDPSVRRQGWHRGCCRTAKTIFAIMDAAKSFSPRMPRIISFRESMASAIQRAWRGLRQAALPAITRRLRWIAPWSIFICRRRLWS